MITRLRSLATRLHARLWPAAPYHPDFGDEPLLMCVAEQAAHPEARDAQEALLALETGSLRAAYPHVARHFRNRSAPSFFVDPPILGELSRHVESQRPDWKTLTLERENQDFERGLRVYGTEGPPLRRGFPWGHLPRGPGNDLLYTVRPHRFAFAPNAARAALYGAPTADQLYQIVTDWMEFAAAEPQPLPYLSNLVVIQRFLALSWAWAFLAARSEDELDGDFSAEIAILKVLKADARFLEKRLGDSFPNNHLLADMFAGWYIGLLFPEFVPASWREKHDVLWLNELRRQTYQDGGSFEHSMHYHELACEMAVAYVLLSRRNGYEPPPWLLDRLERMLRFQVDIAGPDARPLPVGDATEDSLFPLEAGGGWGTAALREIYRALFCGDEPAAPAEDPAVERAFWLLGGNLASAINKNVLPDRSLRAYPESGFFVFGESDPRTRLVFRTGPRRESLLCAGHTHADLLSIYLTTSGIPVLVEAGTYSYSFGPDGGISDASRWRTYFLGPKAHNGLSCNQEDPLGPVTGAFRNRDVPARVETTRWLAGSVGAWVEGMIDTQGVSAYQGYRRGVVHVPGEYWLVYDLLSPLMSFKQSFFSFQFPPEAQVATGPSTVQAKIRGTHLSITGNEGLSTPHLVCGRTDPPGGWVSPRYGELTPAPQAIFGIDGTSRRTVFVIRGWQSDPGVLSVEGQGTTEEGLAFRAVSENFVDHVLLRPESGKTPLEAWGIRFDGAMLWLRTAEGKPIAMRCLESRSVTSHRLGIDVISEEVVHQMEIRSTPTGIDVQHCSVDRLSIAWRAREG